MAFPYKRILNPIDFDENSMLAVDASAQLARQNDGTVLLLHVVPIALPPAGMPVYVDVYKPQEDLAKEKVLEVARKRLQGVKYELITSVGEPAGTILKAEKRLNPDVVVMATHGRRGFSRLFLGSIAEVVAREAGCPVLMVKQRESDRGSVGHWMTANPVTAELGEKLSAVQDRMQKGNFRSMPVVSEGNVVGIVTDRDLRRHTGSLEHTEVKTAMAREPLTVTPETSLKDAARLLRERKIGALPVLDGGKLVGVISTSDVLEAFTTGD